MDGAPLLVVVTGPPGAGKSTLARRLADDLRLPLLAKDDVKEALFDTLGAADVEESRRLGIGAFEVLFRTAAELLRADVPLVLEGNFSDRELFARLPPARIVQLYLEAPAELLLERYLGRGGRHPGHHTEGYAAEIRARLEAGEWRPLDLPGPLIRIDTTTPVDLHAVAKWIIAP